MQGATASRIGRGARAAGVGRAGEAGGFEFSNVYKSTLHCLHKNFVFVFVDLFL